MAAISCMRSERFGFWQNKVCLLLWFPEPLCKLPRMYINFVFVSFRLIIVAAPITIVINANEVAGP